MWVGTSDFGGTFRDTEELSATISTSVPSDGRLLWTSQAEAGQNPTLSLSNASRRPPGRHEESGDI